MQNTSVTGLTTDDATLCANVTRTARLCSRIAICAPDHAGEELRNKFNRLAELIKRAEYPVGSCVVDTVAFRAH
jgi:hypothetical protein